MKKLNEIAKTITMSGNTKYDGLFSIEYNNAPYAVCTNGYIMMLSPIENFEPVEIQPVKFEVAKTIEHLDSLPIAEIFTSDIEAIDKQIPKFPVYEMNTCRECDGEGYLECDMGHEHDCKKCDGEGKIPNKKNTLSYTCNSREVAIDIDGVLFNPDWIFKMLTISAAMDEVVIKAHSLQKGKVAIFKIKDVIVAIIGIGDSSCANTYNLPLTNPAK